MSDIAAPPDQLSDAERREILDREVAKRVRRGMRVEAQGAYQAILVKGRRPNHLLHLILSILTAGVWLILVWLPLWAFGGEKRQAVRVDERGRVKVKRGAG